VRARRPPETTPASSPARARCTVPENPGRRFLDAGRALPLAAPLLALPQLLGGFAVGVVFAVAVKIPQDEGLLVLVGFSFRACIDAECGAVPGTITTRRRRDRRAVCWPAWPRCQFR
jgi:hypothetical protein